MKKKSLFHGLAWLTAFAIWTVLVCLIDVQPIGPMESTVGFATLNEAVHKLIGEKLFLYYLTDWLSLIPVAVMAGAALVGAVQLIRRRSLLSVDRGILALGAIYGALAVFYVLFEAVPINFRPVLIEGALEASYPSSTTLLVLCVMPTAAMYVCSQIREKRLVYWLSWGFAVAMVLMRLMSGVHWFTDIVGGVLLSAALIELYRAICNLN